MKNIYVVSYSGGMFGEYQNENLKIYKEIMKEEYTGNIPDDWMSKFSNYIDTTLCINDLKKQPS